MAGRPRVWSAEYGTTFWDIGPDGRALITVPVDAGNATDTSEAPAEEAGHHIVVLQNFFDHLEFELPLR